MTATGFRNQVQNKNFLSPTGFKFILNRAPKVVFFSNQANIPGLNLGTADQATYLTDIPVPGDKLQFQDLNLRFLVDEDLENYLNKDVIPRKKLSDFNLEVYAMHQIEGEEEPIKLLGEY